ncbi:hypothetical protein [Enterococcus sp. AZ126]|uniref:hypothetical protein n=1 Tax=Enterococcus sp. AZ126 TaxID=2774635 RepID=UPI003F28B4AF
MFGNLILGTKSTNEQSKISPRKLCEVGPCPCGYYFKKGGWSTGGTKISGGYCIPMGNLR